MKRALIAMIVGDVLSAILVLCVLIRPQHMTWAWGIFPVVVLCFILWGVWTFQALKPAFNVEDRG